MTLSWDMALAVGRYDRYFLVWEFAILNIRHQVLKHLRRNDQYADRNSLEFNFNVI